MQEEIKNQAIDLILEASQRRFGTPDYFYIVDPSSEDLIFFGGNNWDKFAIENNGSKMLSENRSNLKNTKFFSFFSDPETVFLYRKIHERLLSKSKEEEEEQHEKNFQHHMHSDSEEMMKEGISEKRNKNKKKRRNKILCVTQRCDGPSLLNQLYFTITVISKAFFGIFLDEIEHQQKQQQQQQKDKVSSSSSYSSLSFEEIEKLLNELPPLVVYHIRHVASVKRLIPITYDLEDSYLANLFSTDSAASSYSSSQNPNSSSESFLMENQSKKRKVHEIEMKIVNSQEKEEEEQEEVEEKEKDQKVQEEKAKNNDQKKKHKKQKNKKGALQIKQCSICQLVRRPETNQHCELDTLVEDTGLKFFHLSYEVCPSCKEHLLNDSMVPQIVLPQVHKLTQHCVPLSSK